MHKYFVSYKLRKNLRKISNKDKIFYSEIRAAHL